MALMDALLSSFNVRPFATSSDEVSFLFLEDENARKICFRSSSCLFASA